MIGSLITSQTRIKLLKRFFLNSSTRAHLRGLEAEFGDSTNSIRIELNRLEHAGLLTSSRDGNKKFFQANLKHPLFEDIHNIIIKEAGLDTLIIKVANRIGDLQSVYLTGDFAQGKESEIIDILLIGDNLNKEYLGRKIFQSEKLIRRSIRARIINVSEAKTYLRDRDSSEFLLLWDASQATRAT